MSLRENVALVTGGSRGIGRAVCLELARQGAAVAVNYGGSAEAAEETVQLCRELGVEAEAFQADVSDPAACDALVSAVKERFGRLDILINNAGIARDGLLMTAKEADFDQTLDTNLKGAFNMIRHCTGLFLRAKEGCIVNITSVVGMMGNAGQCNYAASKAGVIGMTKTLAKELARRNITANAVAPGFIATDMTDALSEAQKEAIVGRIGSGRLGEPADIAHLVRFLASDEASYITGQVICVDGGMSL